MTTIRNATTAWGLLVWVSSDETVPPLSIPAGTAVAGSNTLFAFRAIAAQEKNPTPRKVVGAYTPGGGTPTYWPVVDGRGVFWDDGAGVLRLDENQLQLQVPFDAMRSGSMTVTLGGGLAAVGTLTQTATQFAPVQSGLRFSVAFSWGGGALASQPAEFVFPSLATLLERGSGGAAAAASNSVPYITVPYRSMMIYVTEWVLPCLFKVAFWYPDPVGFEFETFGTPPPGSRPALPFYRSVTDALVPGALFIIESADGTQAVTADRSKGLTWKPKAPAATQGASRQLFSFMFAGGSTKTPVLVLLVPDGLLACRFPDPDPGKDGATDASKVTFEPFSGTSSGAPVCGVAQLLASNFVVLLVRNTSGSVGPVCFKGAPGSASSSFLAAGGWDRLNPPGFVARGNVADPAFAVSLTLAATPAVCAPEATAYKAQTCWTSSPAGCESGKLPTCVVATTQAGARTCAAGCSDGGGPQYIQSAHQFLQQTCLAAHDSSACNPVAGTPTATCTGFGLPGFGPACRLACSVVGPEACDNLTTDFCAQPANASMGDCSCLNVETSSFPAALERGMSFPALQRYLLERYGLGGAVQLRPDCWWPTCAADDTGAIRRSAPSPCPTSVLQCSVDVEEVIAKDSTVDINIVQDCGFSSSPAAAACSSYLVKQQPPQLRLRRSVGAPGAAAAAAEETAWLPAIIMVGVVVLFLVAGIVLQILVAAATARRTQKNLAPWHNKP